MTQNFSILFDLILLMNEQFNRNVKKKQCMGKPNKHLLQINFFIDLLFTHNNNLNF